MNTDERWERVYTEAQGDANKVPWALSAPSPYLQNWLEQTAATAGQSALVVACGLGDDAEALAAAGYQVTAFDLSETAIRWAKQRFPHSQVDYRLGDLFDLPADWENQFDLVFEFRTIQALPLTVRETVMSQVAKPVVPGGTLLVITYLRDENLVPDGPPWPLTDAELAYFETLGLQVVRRDRFQNRDSA
ncbi:MAG: methyltransferase domain-containing protein, partial [Leptolyngbya sp. SIO4C1]|nr:methyltransferase domain-containing protein [Leptolyngbya sp. SIO4C1]